MTIRTHAQRAKGVFAHLSALAVMTTIPALATAQNYVFDINSAGDAVAIEQPDPGYPGGSVRSGQEGWVRLSFVVTADGRAVDPIVIDSSGGGGFEVEARRVIDRWRFEAPDSGDESPYNVADLRSEIFRGRDAATSNFIRRTRKILIDLHNEENESARKQADIAHEMGGWNLYESTMLWLMIGRVEGAEGNHAGKLETYQRSLAMGNSKSIDTEDRIDLLEKIFLLQTHFNQNAAAARTADNLRKLAGSADAALRIADRSKSVDDALASGETLSAQATISNPCDCDEGEPSWNYVPARRTFSFANINGSVDRFEARCEKQRISDVVNTDDSWTLDPDWGSCRVFVFGDDDATFDFVEHVSAPDDVDPGAQTAVAGSQP